MTQDEYMAAYGLDRVEIGIRQKWSRQEVLEEVKKVGASGDRKRIRELTRSAEIRFGSMKNAAALAGIDPKVFCEPNHWNKNKVIQTIRELHKGTPDPIRAGQILKDDSALYAASVRYFHGWNNALRAAGIIPFSLVEKGVRATRQGRSAIGGWSEERIIAEIASLAKQGGQLNPAAVRLGAGRNLYTASIRFFGSWQQAVLAAGVPEKQTRRLPKWDRERVLLALREFHAKRKARENLPYFLVKAVERFFGSLRKGIHEAGLPEQEYLQNRRWTQESVIRAMQDRSDSGKPMSYNRVRAEDSGLAVAAVKFFVTWSDALLAAGLR